MASPIDRLIDQACMRCTKCGAEAGACDCFVRCECGHTHFRGDECRNGLHIYAKFVASNVIIHMRMMYRDEMKAKSGGFQKTLKATIIRECLKAFEAETNDE